ncbi:MAG: RNA polymerase sigma factor [Solirubrobacteraceae bacterium]
MPERRVSSPSVAGHAAASGFESFFREHHQAVVRLAYGVLGDFQRAQDVAQEVFLAAHRRFGDQPQQAAGWVRVAAVHTALNTLRGERRRVRRDRSLKVAQSLPSAEESAIDRESRAELRLALGRLPHRSAAVVVMRHGGMSYAEIAAALGVKVGHVGTMLSRAESALCKEMNRAARH